MNVRKCINDVVEIKKSNESPDPCRFYPKDILIKNNRFTQRNLGSGTRYKLIPFTPGPADYNSLNPCRRESKRFIKNINYPDQQTLLNSS
jgi:hypothetical protein